MFLSLKSFYIFKLYVSLSSIGYLIYQLIQHQSSDANSLEVNPAHPSARLSRSFYFINNSPAIAKFCLRACKHWDRFIDFKACINLLTKWETESSKLWGELVYNVFKLSQFNYGHKGAFATRILKRKFLGYFRYHIYSLRRVHKLLIFKDLYREREDRFVPLCSGNVNKAT